MTTIPNIEFKTKVFISGTILSETGLHIGGSSTEMSIGGADHIVIRDPMTNWPYIPGSSLRGKIRSLLEKTTGEMTIEMDSGGKKLKRVKELAEALEQGKKIKSAGPSTDPKSDAGKLFGVAIDKSEADTPEKVIPQRLVVRDAMLINADLLETARNTDMPLTEVKTEVAIDRITSKANPRQIERVPAGAKFRFEFILNLYGNDDENEYIKRLFQCMELLQDDYLGGHGSRGYGKVRFQIESITKKSVQDYRENKAPEKVDITIPDTLKFEE